jgi:hypothetical protein
VTEEIVSEPLGQTPPDRREAIERALAAGVTVYELARLMGTSVG